MSAAPAVELNGRPLLGWIVLCASLVALAGIGLTTWAFGRLPGPLVWTVLPALAVAVATAEWRKSRWQLHWSGGAWTLDGHPVTVQRAAALGGGLLLVARPTSRPSLRRARWLAVGAARDPDDRHRIHGLRLALAQPAPAAPSASAQ